MKPPASVYYMYSVVASHRELTHNAHSYMIKQVSKTRCYRLIIMCIRFALNTTVSRRQCLTYIRHNCCNGSAHNYTVIDVKMAADADFSV